MKIVVIDGQGGSIGKEVIDQLRKSIPDADILAVGTNSTATLAMLKAGASASATGENPVVVACRTADIIVGPIGIIESDALLGEITPKMAAAISSSSGEKVLIPVNRCKIHIAGQPDIPLHDLIVSAVSVVRDMISRQKSLPR